MIMKLKGGDSNKKFQTTFFKHQVKCEGGNKEFQNTEKNRNKFWSSQKNFPCVTDAPNEIIALNAVALISAISTLSR